MSAVTAPSHTLVRLAREGAETREEPPPCAPMAWLRGALLPLSALPRWQRLVYRVLRLPALVRVEPEGENRVLDIEGARYRRDRGVAKCSGPDDYVWGIAFEDDLGAQVRKPPTFSRPRHPAYREQEERDAALYTGDLRECIDMALAAENARLRRKVALYEEFIFGVGPVLDECDDLVRHLRT